MRGRWLAAGLLAAMPAMAQVGVIHAWFRDGAGVELSTEITGSRAQTAVHGGGMIKNGTVSRLVEDSQNTRLFAYEIEAEKASEPGSINIRIRPASLGGPTVSAPRLFLGVKKGQEVRMEILANSATGEKVYDVLRPLDGPNPHGGGPVIESVMRPAPGSAVSLVVNGQALAVKCAWTPGKPARLARLALPGKGAYYLSWENRPGFRLAGYMDKNRLVFLYSTDYVEITGANNMLAAAGSGPVWVYFDSGFTPVPAVAELSVADPEAIHVEATHAKN